MPFRMILLVCAAALLSSPSFAETVPVPQTKPTEKNNPDVGAVTTPIPVPDAKPVDATPAENKPSETKTPSDQPVEAKPVPDVAPAPDTKADEKKTEEKAEPVLTIEPESDSEHAACIADLKAIGATFEAAKRIDDGNGCGIDKPIDVTGVLPGVALEPKGTMRCETALELARWTKEAVLPAAEAAMAEAGPLITINQASSYICRLRNNAKTGKISEHARGNAIDIASFTFKTGKTIAIQPRDEDSTLSGAFQRAVTATGCLYFETVLDPGSDEAHENHLHFDVLQRKGGYRYCR